MSEEPWRPRTDRRAGALWEHVSGEATLMEVGDAESAGRALAHARASGAPAIPVHHRSEAPRPGDPPGALYLEIGGLDAVRALDEESRVVHVQAGVRWRALEVWLRARRLSLGPIPGWLHERSVLQSYAEDDRLRPSPRYGQLTEATLAVRAALPDGAVTRSAVSPRRATGPDLPRCALGMGLRAGLLVEAHLQVWRYPTQQAARATSFASWDEAHAAAARVLRAGVRPAWWCAQRAGRRVLLASSIVGEGDLAAQVARFDAAVGGRVEPSQIALELDAAAFPPLDCAAGCAPLYAVGVARRGALGAALRGRRGAQVWDLRPEGATLYGRTAQPRSRSAEWTTFATALVSHLEAR